MTKKEELEKLLKRKDVTQKEAFAFFDSLQEADISLFHGKWKGKELTTGHPMDGLLKSTNWYGKYFVDEENAYPLLFQKGNKKLFAANPGCLPLKQFEHVNRRIVSVIFKLVTPFIQTKKSSARLREIQYRGKITTAMIYDQKPFFDIFGMVDKDTMLGISDLKWEHELGYFFVIERTKGEGT